MATTKGTVGPIVPYGHGVSGSGSPILSLPVASTQTVRVGDILTLAAGVCTRTDLNHSDGTIVGVAIQPKASVASADYGDQVLLSPALPGAMFIGSMVTTAATDYTANTAAIIAPGTAMNTVLCTDAYAPYIVVNATPATGQIRMLGYAAEQMGGKNFGIFGSTTVINPRVLFAFRCSVFQPIA